MSDLTIRPSPRELSLSDDGVLRVKPLRELESLRYEPITAEKIELSDVANTLLADRSPPGRKIADLAGDSAEIRITVDRTEAGRELFGFTALADGRGGDLPIVFRPEAASSRVGTAEAPSSIEDLPAGEEATLRTSVDRRIVEVFADDRRAMLARHRGCRGLPTLAAFAVGASTRLRKAESWKLASRESRVPRGAEEPGVGAVAAAIDPRGRREPGPGELLTCRPRARRPGSGARR
jgi:sucrose-6-phosphate hydrolase SacC (GH32 family)